MNTVLKMSDAYQAELKSLRTQVEAKDARIFELEQQLSAQRAGEDAVALAVRLKWKFTPGQGKLLAALLAVTPGRVCGYSTLIWLLDPDCSRVDAANLVKTHVCRIRQKLRPDGIAIETISRAGYLITAENRRKIAAALNSKVECA